MDRNSVLRVLVIAVMLLVVWQFGPRMCGSSGTPQTLPAETYTDAPDFSPDTFDPNAKAPPVEGESCTIDGQRFRAELSSRGAGLRHFWLTDERYARSESADMSTTPDVERWRNLRTLFRDPSANDQVKFDRFAWTKEASSANTCRFSYADDDVKIVKTVSAGARPFELNVETSVTNLADAPKKHRYSIGVFAFRRNEEVKGKLGRVSPFQSELSCARAGDVARKSKDDSDFKKGWFSEPLVDRYTAVSNYYFGQALVPLDVRAGEAMVGDKPECDIVAENVVSFAGQKPDDDKAGDVYHALLSYPPKTLTKGESAVYRDIAFFGPKERGVLADAAGGQAKLGDLINLGFFSPVAKVLVQIIGWIHSHITFGNWGIAIIVLTIGLRLMLFPLTWKSIKSGIQMKKLKPEVDALNEKFKDDAQAKNLAMMELWRKHKVNPLGGCLPMLVQMPVWFAMYTTLQTAVEFYKTPFLWFADLSAPDRFFVLPFVLGGFMILQQRIVPMTGVDPMQQKMMTWLLPGIFTVMMLFLPAALGVYMLTNSVLGIVQQLAVQRFSPAPVAPSSPDTKKKREIVVKTVDDKPTTFGKGKARV